MNDKEPSYQDLEIQIAELKKQNEILILQSASVLDNGSEQYCSSIINKIGDPIFVKDEQSKLLFVNDAFCEIFGLSRVDALGKTLAEFVAAEERESFLKIDKQVLASGIENINEETLTLGSGQTRIISTRKTRFIDAEGKVRLIGIIRDITKRYEVEKALKESEALLKDLNSTKDRLFSIIAHDLRNPLHNILGLSELLLEKAKAERDHESTKYIDLILTSAHNTYILLENLLNWAKSETNQISFNPQKIRFSSLISEILELEDTQAKSKKISLELAPVNSLEVFADVNMLKTVLRNLISNAIKYTNSGGQIRVLVTPAKDHIEITISDNGIGIKQERLDGLFEIAQNSTTKGTANEIGSGLGLVLCKEFVEKHQGRIWVEINKQSGCDFKFTLPMQ
jgi:PAS domain S-box-containing protein